MSGVFHLDYETFSEADLTEVGAYRYAEDPSTKVLMLAIARGGEEPVLWLPPRWREAFPDLYDIESEDLLDELRHNPDSLVYAHSAQFERAVTMFADTPLSFMRDRPKQWRCTAAMARRAAVPDSLEKCAAYLDVDAKKDSRGKSLIRKFSMLQTSGKRKGGRILPTDEPDAFREFAAYCLQDVRAEQAVHKALAPFELKGPDVLDTFLLDIHLNDRGIPVNVPALRNARVIIDGILEGRSEEFVALTGLRPTQREAVRGWLATKGVPLDDMQGDTLAEKLATLEPHSPQLFAAIRVLRLYSELRFAAVKKVHTMLDCANADGRVRGTLLYHGAGTGRWSGRGMQPQNFKKPSIKHLKGAFEMLERGCTADDLDTLYGPPLEVISSCIRNFITATLDADYASIEARILPWLAGQEDALERFRRGEDSYRVMAGVIYNKRAGDVTDAERQLGKAAILGAGYGMGASKFQATCEQWGIPITPELAKRAIDAFRAAHPKVVQLWWDCDNAAQRALRQPGRRFTAGAHASFECRRVAGKQFLFMRLPSGREVAYPEAKLEIDPRFDREGVTYYGAIVGKTIWGRVNMYGGKWVENCLSGETLILSKSRGWIRLDSLRDDLLWDGTEWVGHGGLLPRGEQRVIDVHGVRATPDHQFLEESGVWISAELACNRISVLFPYPCENFSLQATPLTSAQLGRSPLWPDDGNSPCGERRENFLGGRVRLRQNQNQGGLGIDQDADRAEGLRLRLRSHEAEPIRENAHARDEQAPSVPGVVFDEAPVSFPNAPGMEELRGSRHNRLRAVAGVFRELLGGHGADVAEGLGLGPRKQRCGLLTGQLPLGYPQAELLQPSPVPSHLRAADSRGKERYQALDSELPVDARLDGRGGGVRPGGHSELVYDIRDCGPRNRFVVRSSRSGAVMIAHNCDQAVAASIMAYGANNAIRQGYDVFTLIHDEALGSHKPGQTVPHFTAALTELPPWAKGLPLKAEGKICAYYAK